MKPSVRRATVLAAAVLIVGLLAPGGATAKAPATTKISSALRGIVEHHLGDRLYGEVVQGHLSGDVYYLAKLASMDDASLDALRAAGATVRHRYDVIGWVALSSPEGAVNRVAAISQVTRLEVDKVLQIATTTATSTAPPAFGDQTKRGTHDVGADAAWLNGITGKDVVVGVTDTGIDEFHSDLAGKVDAFVNCMGVIPSVLTAVNDIGQCVPSPGNDDNGHGTHVSGIVAGNAAGNNELPGMAPDAHLVGAKVCSAAGTCLNSSVMAGMVTLATPKADGGLGAQVINMSLGGGPAYAAGIFDATQETDADPSAQLVDKLAEKYNVLWAIAAGNAGPTLQSVGSPSTASQAMSVGASVTDWDRHHPTDETQHGMNGKVLPDGAPASAKAIAVFSSRGPSGDRQIKPDFTAPGAYVVAAEASTGGEVHAGDAAVGNKYSSDPTYAVLSGTSMAAPSAAGAAALVIDGYHQATNQTAPYYVVKAAMTNTANGNAFEGPVTGLISSIKSNRLGMDPKTLFPPRNDANVGVTGQGAGRVHVPNALLASTAGVVAYTPVSRNADGTLKTSAYQPSWGLNDIGPGEGASQAFVLRGGPNMVDDSASVALSVLPEGEALGVHAAPMDWFTFSGGASASRGSDGGSFTASLSVPANAAPGQYAATILALADLGGGVTQRIRIPVQFFVPTPVGHDLTGPIWASDVTDYSIVGYENPLGQIYTDWSMVPVRVPMGGANTLTFTVWDEAGGSTMDVFVFDATGNEVNSTVGTDAHMVPGGVALTPTSKDSPGTTSVAVVANDATLNFGEVHAGDVLWLVLSNTKPTHPTTFEMYHLSVAAS